MIESNDIRAIWDSTRDDTWESDRFSIKKAYLCSILSELAYLHIPEFERESIKRVKLIPCKKYWDIIKSEKSSTIRDITSSIMEFKEGLIIVFVIERRKMIIIGIKKDNILFVTVRGTNLAINDFFIDMRVNFMASKVKYRSDLKYHSGFFSEVSKVFGELQRELDNNVSHDTKVVFTGHSLGGALATIMYQMYTKYRYERFERFTRMEIFEYFLLDRFDMRDSNLNQCYTFGMPRFGNSDAVNLTRLPFHIFNRYDIVPTLPPKWVGYSDPNNEYCPIGTKLDKILIREKIGIRKRLCHLPRFLTEHRIGEYKRRLGDLLNS